jgi:hypothetical protein
MVGYRHRDRRVADAPLHHDMTASLAYLHEAMLLQDPASLAA